MEGIELRSDERLEDGFVQFPRNTGAVIEHREATRLSFVPCCDEYAASTCVSCIPEKLDDDVLKGSDVLLRLTALRFRCAETHESASEVVLDAKVVLAGVLLYEIVK